MAPIDGSAESVAPWSTRAPQKWAFVALTVVLAVAVMVTAVSYIAQGVGGIVPVLMVVVAPPLAATYVWYFGFKKW